jgi:hypothetical protein
MKPDVEEDPFASRARHAERELEDPWFDRKPPSIRSKRPPPLRVLRIDDPIADAWFRAR